MKITFPLLALALAVLGCGRFASSTASGTNNGANADPAPIKKAVDLPSFLGKSPDEVNKMLGQNEKLSVGTVTYKLPLGSLYFQYHDGKQAMVSFKFDTISEGGLSASGFATAEALGKHVGLDIKGTPSKASYADTYYDFPVNGKKCELQVTKIGESYNGASLMCP